MGLWRNVILNVVACRILSAGQCGRLLLDALKRDLHHSLEPHDLDIGWESEQHLAFYE